MPYDTPYNRMIAQNENMANELYAKYNAYSNEMYNSPRPFSEVFKEIRPPVRQFCPQPFRRVSNYEGGITNRNMEGSAGVLGSAMRHSVMGEDLDRRVGGGGGWDSFVKGFTAPFKFIADPVGSIAHPGKTFGFGDYEDSDQFRKSSVEAQRKKGQEDMKKLQEKNKALKKMAKEQDSKEGVYASLSSDKVGSDGSSSGSDSDFEEPLVSIMTQMKPKVDRTNKPAPPRPTAPKPKGKGKGTRKPSDWIQFIKAYSKKHNMTYKDAMKCPKAKGDYAKLKKEYKGKGMSGGFLNFVLPWLASSAIGAIAGKGDTESEDDEIAGLTQGIERMLGVRSKSAPAVAPIVKPTPRKGDKPKRKAKSPSVSPEVERKVKKSKKEGGSVLGGPSNDPVNKGKIGGQKYMKPTGLKWEGATLGAGKKTKKTGSALFKAQPVVPLDVKSGIPPSEEQIEGIHDSKEVQGNGKKSKKKGGMLKSEMQGSTFSGGAKKTSKWITHVKAYAKQHGVKYGEALKLAKASYKK